MLRRLAFLSPVFLASCIASTDQDTEALGKSEEALTAYCTANVIGKGHIDAETKYLPNVVHCENGGAPYEALKAQAIAARTYLYYKMSTSGSLKDGEGDQVYSCGSSPTAAQIKAVKETAGQFLRYKGTTISAFFVAGGAAKPTACHGAYAATEHYVTYNNGLSGSKLHQTSLGWISPTNYANRGCMSQLGSRCLASMGKTDDNIIHFYYGADIEIATATGPCVEKDTDSDGIPDSKDNCDTVKNADQKDTDKDGKGDACDTDDDNDGVLDTKDDCPTVKNADQKNTDGDKFGDACDSDDDNDGIADTKDNCPLVKNPGQQDLDKDKKGDACDDDIDGDGVKNAVDNCPTIKNADQKDTDKDGKGDVCENDDDGDGVLDDKDVCPKVADPDQLDTDKDGIGDACDDDIDGDGIKNDVDNCKLTANPDQKDENLNGIGDACELDSDEDGIPDSADNCPAFDNPDQVDSDGDGIGDACADADSDGIPDVTDNCPKTANPDQSDRDADGIGDVCDPEPDTADTSDPPKSDDAPLPGEGESKGGCSYDARSSAGSISPLLVLGLIAIGCGRSKRSPYRRREK